MKTKILGYGIFSGVYWGSAMKNWQFETIVGIQPTEEDVENLCPRILHCLSKETRRIFPNTMLNIGNENSPHFIKASTYIKNRNKYE